MQCSSTGECDRYTVYILRLHFNKNKCFYLTAGPLHHFNILSLMRQSHLKSVKFLNWKPSEKKAISNRCGRPSINQTMCALTQTLRPPSSQYWTSALRSSVRHASHSGDGERVLDIYRDMGLWDKTDQNEKRENLGISKAIKAKLLLWDIWHVTLHSKTLSLQAYTSCFSSHFRSLWIIKMHYLILFRRQIIWHAWKDL